MMSKTKQKSPYKIYILSTARSVANLLVRITFLLPAPSTREDTPGKTALLKPGVVQIIVMPASPTARQFNFIFFIILPQGFACVKGIANAVSLVLPRNETGLPARPYKR